MCGISGCFGGHWRVSQLEAMLASQRHRGPDAEALHLSPSGLAGLGHNRLSIIDLSPAGSQPMCDPEGRLWLVFNGEIFNYLELRAELSHDYRFKSHSDTEVLLAAYQKWGSACLDKLIGMFAFAVWDEQEQTLFAARDRFGIKPLYYHQQADGTLLLASEIKALHQAGVKPAPDATGWATYLVSGYYDFSERTFWDSIKALPPGHTLKWQHGQLSLACWYDLAARLNPELDQRPAETVAEEYLALLINSVRLRFRSDVPVGINLSGGLDSSLLLGLVHRVQGADSAVTAFTFTTGDPRYDEIYWVNQMLAHTKHPSLVSQLRPEEVPALAASVRQFDDEPFGGLPTLAYAKLFADARAAGVIVLLDGNGLDEQWAGYDYYLSLNGGGAALVQGAKSRVTLPECLLPEFSQLAEAVEPPRPFPDALRNTQYRDIRYTKIPRSLRFNDRISMRASTELRQPFLDHRLMELALNQPPERKIAQGKNKVLPRQIAQRLLPNQVSEAPKRPMQTPQREWLRAELRAWATECIETALEKYAGQWLQPHAVRHHWRSYCAGEFDNSFFVWQWISLGLI